MGAVAPETNHFIVLPTGIDERSASWSVHDNGAALYELTPVNNHTLRDSLSALVSFSLPDN